LFLTNWHPGGGKKSSHGSPLSRAAIYTSVTGINFEIAAEYDGRTYLWLDDTNPKDRNLLF
jgi:hypothetical protein